MKKLTFVEETRKNWRECKKQIKRESIAYIKKLIFIFVLFFIASPVLAASNVYTYFTRNAGTSLYMQPISVVSGDNLAIHAHEWSSGAGCAGGSPIQSLLDIHSANAAATSTAAHAGIFTPSTSQQCSTDTLYLYQASSTDTVQVSLFQANGNSEESSILIEKIASSTDATSSSSSSGTTTLAVGTVVPVDNMPSNLFQGFILFFLAMCFPIWLFKSYKK